MERAWRAGKVRAYGWSTDLSASVRAVADRPGFMAVQHAMNIFIDAPGMQATVQEKGLHAFIRSPLGMGLLTGKYDAVSVMPAGDIRATANTVTGYFRDARPNPLFLAQLDAVRDLLTIAGRTPAQGALSWLWAKSERNIRIPGARTVAQIEGLAGALAFGPLPADVMAEIERVLARQPEEERPRQGAPRSPRRDRLLAAIVVEAALGLAAEPAGLDVLHQQRAGPVLRVGQPLVQHLHDR